VAAAWSPTDGHCAPEAVVLGYVAAARRSGARVFPRAEVTAIAAASDGGHLVTAGLGEIACDVLVIAAGAWSGLVGELAGLPLPVTPVRRQIVVSEGLPGRRSDTPMTIDFSTSFYFHNEADGLLIGMSDRQQTPGFELDRDDAWLTGLADAIERRAPRLAELGIRTGWAGLYELTPDHNGLVGRVGDVVYATGFSGHGFLMGPAVGEVVRDLCLGEQPVIDVAPLSLDRFAAEITAEHVIV
jgi:sarcosine oxidase subunit beta